MKKYLHLLEMVMGKKSKEHLGIQALTLNYMISTVVNSSHRRPIKLVGGEEKTFGKQIEWYIN